MKSLWRIIFNLTSSRLIFRGHAVYVFAKLFSISVDVRYRSRCTRVTSLFHRLFSIIWEVRWPSPYSLQPRKQPDALFLITKEAARFPLDAIE